MGYQDQLIGPNYKAPEQVNLSSLFTQPKKLVQAELFELPEQAVASPEAAVVANVTVPIKLVVTLNVPTAFLRNVEDNTALVRLHMEELAVSLYGTVASVDII